MAVGGRTAGAYFAYQIGPGGSAGADAPAGATEAASPTATLETVTPTAEPTIVPPTPSPSATALSPTQPPPTTTQPPTPTPDPACAARDHNHLNIDKLAAQPNLGDAIVTEVDDRAVRIELEGSEFIVQGWGEVVIIREPPSVDDELSALIGGAVDNVRYEC